MTKIRLAQLLTQRNLASTHSQAENYIKLGLVKVNGKIINKNGFLVSKNVETVLLTGENYVSRAALKLNSVADKLKIDFRGKVTLDVGSSTGGFSDFALQHGANKVIAVDVGTNQMHPSLRTDPRIELHEQADIRELKLSIVPDIVLIDVSFISLREVLPTVAKLSDSATMIIAMVKPQFEADDSQKSKGIIKNEKMRRNIFQQIETWIQKLFVIVDKADSEITGQKGNKERFYKLKLL